MRRTAKSSVICCNMLITDHYLSFVEVTARSSVSPAFSLPCVERCEIKLLDKGSSVLITVFLIGKLGKENEIGSFNCRKVVQATEDCFSQWQLIVHDPQFQCSFHCVNAPKTASFNFEKIPFRSVATANWWVNCYYKCLQLWKRNSILASL